MRDDIDRGLSRKPQPRGFAFLFWACIIGLFVFWPSDVTQAEPPTDETVAVPKAELAALQVAHARMRDQIETMERDQRIAEERASACLANNSWSGFKERSR